MQRRAETGRLFYRQKRSVRRADLTGLYQNLASACKADRLGVVPDNAPFHFHPDALRKLEMQVWLQTHPAVEYRLPSQWSDPTQAASRKGDLPVQVVPLPLDASWLNPIERLWRLLKQEGLHLPPYAEDWRTLKRGVRGSLDRFTEGAPKVLQYVGLSGA